MAIPYNPWTTGGSGSFLPLPSPTEGGGILKPKATTKRISPTGETLTEEVFGPSLEDELGTREKFNALAQQRQLSAIQSLLGGVSSPASSVPLAGAPGGVGFDEGAARSAAFGRAKDVAGQTGRASLDALRGILSSSGRLGGQFEAEKTAQIVGGAAGDINEFTREQLIQDLQRAGEISDREAAAALTRRGQDITQLANRQSALTGLISALQGGTIY